MPDDTSGFRALIAYLRKRLRGAPQDPHAGMEEWRREQRARREAEASSNMSIDPQVERDAQRRSAEARDTHNIGE
jgi:hypothetical protein